MPLELVTLVVRDYDEAIRFFVDVLDFTLVEDSPSLTNGGQSKRWVVVRPPSGVTGLVLALVDSDEQSKVVGNQTADRVGFFLRVEDFRATYERMRKANVIFESEPRHEIYGDVVVFRDVAGNKWDLLGPADPA